ERVWTAGVHPHGAGPGTLPRLAGASRALEITMAGRMVEAPEALAIGMVDRVVAAADLAAETERVARAIAGGPPIAVAGIKRALAASRTNGLREQIELESEEQLRAFLSADAAEGMAAFFAKRAPSFRGE